MNIIQKIVFGIKSIGFKAVLETVLSSIYRDWIDFFYSVNLQLGKEDVTQPQKIIVPKMNVRGGRFNFGSTTLEITFLTDDFVRLTWQPGNPPIPYAIAPTDWETVDIQSRATAEGWLLTSRSMQILVHHDGGVDFLDIEGVVIRSHLPPQKVNSSWVHQAQLSPDEHIYGLGEKATSLNRVGKTYQMKNQDPGGSYGLGQDPLYMNIPVYIGINKKGAYLVFFENSFHSKVVFKTDGTEKFYFSGGMLRYYYAFGSVDQLINRYLRLTGLPPMPPKWALGYHQSRWGYKTEKDIRDVVREFKVRDLPLSAVHLDIDYMDGYRVFTVDKNRFPDIGALTDELRRDGIHLVPILDVGVKIDSEYDLYKDGLENDVFCKTPKGVPVKGRVWPGWCVFPDFLSEKGRSWWTRQYPRLLNEGVSGFWHDMNEPSAFVAWGEPSLPIQTRYSFEGRGGTHLEANNLYGLLMNQAGFDALKRYRPNRRPWIVSRSGWAGVQRYAWNWTADVESSWSALRMTLSMLLGLSLSGILFSGSDIGGFSGNPDAELFVRWFQLAAFTPFFRGHSAVGTKRREPWVFGDEVTDILRGVLHFRYRLMPYVYTTAWQASQYGYPLMRTLFWKSAQLSNLLNIEDEFYFGDNLLVAPILEPGIQKREVFLPNGLWYDLWSDRAYQGNQTVVVETSLEKIPVFVREGSVLPMEEEGALVLKIFAPGGENGMEFESTLYSDSGDGFGEWRVDKFSVKRSSDNISVEHQVSGQYVLPYKSYKIELHGIESESIVVGGIARTLTENAMELDELESFVLSLKKLGG